MKTKNYFKAAFIIAATFAFGQVRGQTALSGTAAASNSCGSPAGTLGTDNTNVGCGAGAAIIAGGNQNTLVGKSAGNTITTADNNTFVGYIAGKANTSGANNTFVGDSCGRSNTTGTGLTFIGNAAGGLNTTADNNTAVGWGALHNNGVLLYNTAVGYQALYSDNTLTCGTCATNASTNTAVGYQTLMNSQAYGGCAFGFWAGVSNTSGCSITAMGEEACRFNTTGDDNVGIGAAALHNNATGEANTAVGDNAGAGTASNNFSNGCFFGKEAGVAVSTGGDNNVFIGYQAGVTNTTGSSNTFLGYKADNTGAATITNAAAIGANTVVKVSNNMVLGDNSTKVGIRLSGDATGANCPFAVGGNGLSNYEAYIYNPNSGASIQGIRGEALAPTGANKAYGVTGAITSGAGYATGTYGAATNATAQTSGRAYGIYGIASNATDGYNYGVYGKFNGSTNNKGAGVFGADCHAGDSLVGDCYAGYFAGKISVRSGTAEKYGANTWNTISDKRLKTNIVPFKDGLDVLRKINPVNYEYNGLGGLPTNTTQVGIIAQEVEKVAPYCVGRSNMVLKEGDQSTFSGDIIETIPHDGTTSYIASVRSYNPDGLFYVLINSVKQLDSLNKAKDEKLQEMENRIKQLEAVPAKSQQNTAKGSTAAASSMDVDLKDGQSVVLDQNVPNPFAEQTVINYFLPENTAKAQMLFYNAQGKLIQSVDLNERGKCSLNVFAADLSNGTYTYTLVVDGKVAETKKMIKQ